MKILITRRVHPEAVFLLREHFDVEYSGENRPFDVEKLNKVAGNYDGILSNISERFDAELLMKSAHKLKVISNMAVGTDNIDTEAAMQFGIKVFNTPDVVTAPTADFTLALGLDLLRKTHEAHNHVMQKKWLVWDPEILLGHNMNMITWGIIGYGRIGRAVAERVKSFGSRILFYDELYEGNDEINAKRAELDYLIEQSDVISLHIPLTKGSAGFFDSSKFNKMKRNAYLINTSRGGVVDTNALLEALQNETIAGAALDVFYPEPIPENHEIFNCKNVIFAPHIGTATIECRREIAVMAARNLVSFLC